MKTAEALEKEAIKAAWKENWPRAIKANLSLLKSQPKNIAALNRLAWAYTKQGKIRLAQTTYKKVLDLDKYNLIANKNLKRLCSTGGKPPSSKIPIEKIPSLFLEESGKTKLVSLVRLGSPQVLAGLQCGEPVKLVPKKRRISVTNMDNYYLGIIPDDLSFRLLKFIKGGNQYKAWVKGGGRKNLQIFIREAKRSLKFKNLPSFPSLDVDYETTVSSETIYQEREEISPTDED